jgi:protein phosphatase
MSLLFFGKSDVGIVRSSNQDSIFMDEQLRLFIVADGMGGHRGGDIASKSVTKIVPEFIRKKNFSNPKKNLSEAINHSNKLIFEHGQQDPLLKGMGTTATVLHFHPPKLYIANVGDSRSYLINKNKIYQLTRDHTIIQDKIYHSIYTRKEASLDPAKNILSKTVGYEENITVDIFDYNVQKNDIFLTCSDGLHSMVSDQDILFLINKYLPDPQNAVQKDVEEATDGLLSQANASGGKDNISIIINIAQQT